MADKGNYGIEITFDAETAKFDGSIKSMDKAIKALKKDIAAVNTNLKFDNLNKDLLTKKWLDYQEVIKATEQKLKQYKTELSKVYDENRNVVDEKEWIRLRGEISETEAELVKLRDQAAKIASTIADIDALKKAKEFEQWGKGLDKASKYAQSMAQALLPLSVAATAGLGGAAKAAIEFESAMAGVKKTVEETPTTTYEQLEKAFREMALEVPASATEIAAVAEMAGQLGIEADSIKEFTRVMIDLGNATNLTATDGAKAVAQFFNIMGHDSKEVKELVDNFGAAVTALGNNSATTEEDIVYMAKALAAASHTVGLTDQEVLGLATSLASLGLSAERGGSAMSTVMRKIHTDVNMVTDAGEERLAAWGSLMGMTAEEFRKAWNEDSVRVLHDIVKGLNETEDAGKSLYEVLSDVDVSNIRQVDTISRLALGYDRFDEYMAMANDEWEKNTALTIEANRRYATTESQLKMLKNKLVDVGITLGETILPIINDLISKARPLLDRLNNFVARNGKLVTTLLAVGSALSPLLFGVSKVLKLTGTLATAASKFIKLGTQATTVFGQMGAIIGAGVAKAGLVSAVAALTIGVGALAYAWIKAKDDVYQFNQAMNQLDMQMDNSIAKADEEYEARMRVVEGNMIYAKRVDELMQVLKEGNLTEAGQAEIKDRIRAAVDQLNQALGTNKYAFDEDTNSILVNGQATESTADSYQKMIDEMRKTTWLETHKQALQEAMNSQAEAIKMMTEATDTYRDSIQQAEDAAKSFGMSEEMFNRLKNIALEGGDISEIVDAFAQTDAFMSEFGGNYQQLQQEIQTLADSIASSDEEANEKIAAGNELLREANAIIDEYYAAAGMPVEQFLLWESTLGRTVDLENDSIIALEEQKRKLQEIIATEAERGAEGSALATAAQTEIEKIDQAIAKRQEQEEQKQLAAESTSQFLMAKIDEQMAYAEEQNQAKDDNMLGQDQTMSDSSKTYFVNAMAEAVRQINAMRLEDKHVKVWVDLMGAGAAYLNGGGSISSGGFNAYKKAGFTQSGGYQSGNYNVTINSNVNVNGGNVSALQAKVFAEQIVETVNNELGKRLRYA